MWILFLTKVVETPVKMENYEPSFTKMFLALGVFVACAFIALWCVRKFSKKHASSHHSAHTIQVLGQKGLSHKTVLYLVKAGNQEFFIAESQNQVSMSSLSPETENIPSRKILDQDL